MHFTQEDYRKIESWLYQRTVKDTELPMADPLNNTELIPILQDNKNKTIGLNDFVKKVADMKLPDFYNVTTNSKKTYLTLEEATSLVPIKQRKLGLTITYHNECGNWLIYQFKGDSLNQWSSLNYWNNIIQQAIEELVLYPDEEDIIGVRDGNRTFLKFKNRDYDPEEFSGMGMVILRKNLVGTAACSIDDEDHLNNILTQEMIGQENTVYIIQYDFDLDGKVISIPKGSTLWFQGGTINNGTMYLQETPILGVFEFADMGTVKLFGNFNVGQVMTFTNENYESKEESYFIKSEPEGNVTRNAPDLTLPEEVYYTENPNAYSTKTRQELKWWNGEEWLLILDITDYAEIKSIINDLVDKHNAEMAGCYRYFKARCYALELRMDDAERRLTDHDTTLNNHETRINNTENSITNINREIGTINTNINSIEGDINSIEQNVTNVTNDISNITNSITDIQSIVENIDQTINDHIQQFVENNIIGVASITVNGQKHTPDNRGNINLPDYPDKDGGTADKVIGKLKFTGASTAEYDGSSNVTVNIPEGSSGGTTAKETLTIKQGNNTLGTYNGTEPKTITIPESTGGVADKVANKLKFTGAVSAEYDGSTEITVNIPSSTGGGTGTTIQPLIFKGAVNDTYDGSVQKEITIPSPGTITDLDTKLLTLQDQKGNTRCVYNAKEDKAIRAGSILIKQNSGDVLHDALDSNQITLDLRPYMNGANNNPIILYCAELTRSAGSIAWKEAYSKKHPGIGAAFFSTSDCLLMVSFGIATGWNVNIAAACANSRDMDPISYSLTDGGRLRSNGGWIQCATNASRTVFLHAWRTGDKYNDTVYADCLHKDGKCLGLSLVVTGYATKVN